MARVSDITHWELSEEKKRSRLVAGGFVQHPSVVGGEFKTDTAQILLHVVGGPANVCDKGNAFGAAKLHNISMLHVSIQDQTTPFAAHIARVAVCGEMQSVFVLSDHFKIYVQINPFRMPAASVSFVIIQKLHSDILLPCDRKRSREMLHFLFNNHKFFCCVMKKSTGNEARE
jgi:hypothetical protein